MSSEMHSSGVSTPVSVPTSQPTVPVSAATSLPVSSPVISQVESSPPLVSTHDVSAGGALTPEQMRAVNESLAQQAFNERTRAARNSGNSNGQSRPAPGSAQNPFTMGQNPNFSSSGTSGEPSRPVHGVSPSAHGANLQGSPSASMTENNPFRLGNRAHRGAAAVSGGMKRGLNSMDLKNINYEPQAGVVASEQKIQAIGIALASMGISSALFTEVGVYLARHCADVGASDKSTLLGTFPGSNITLEEVGAKIKQTEGCTLRQYCAYYAKHVWNLMLQTQIPPANWSGREFKFETRYAAFDFFYGVESSAALEPVDGLIRLPTQAERVANATSKEIKMFRILSLEGTQAVNFGEVTGGKIGPKPVLSVKK